MMCSTWKISVFGIVALMLAFGLTAGDAFAHSDGHSEHTRSTVPHFTDATIIVKAYSTETTDPPAANGNGGGRKDRDVDGVNLLTADPEDGLRATEVLDALEFVYTVGQTPVKGKGITITIPSGWTPATEDVNDGYNRDGEVELYVAGVMKRDKLRVTSRSMKFTGIDPALDTGDTVVFRFKRVKVPVRADTYEFGVISEMTGEKHVNKVNPHLLEHMLLSLLKMRYDPDPWHDPAWESGDNHAHRGRTYRIPMTRPMHTWTATGLLTRRPHTQVTAPTTPMTRRPKLSSRLMTTGILSPPTWNHIVTLRLPGL